MSADPDDIAVFLEESTELLADFEQCLLLLENLPDDPEALNRAFRAAHTIKGGAGMVGFEPLQHFTHRLENLLDNLRQGGLICTRPVIDALLASSDLVKAYLEELRHGRLGELPGQSAVVAKIEAVLATEGQAAAAEPPSAASAPPPAAAVPTPVAAAPVSAASAAPPPVQPPAPVVAAAPAAPVAAVSAPAAAAHPPPSAPPASTGAPAALSLATPAAVSAHAAAGAGEPANASPAPANAGPRAELNPTIRVPLEKLDRLVNLVGELAITQSMVSQELSHFSANRLAALQDAAAQLERYCRELQERVLGIRMLPVKSMFDRFQRVVRDLSSSTGKQVSLTVLGEDTELDKTVIEKITDPMTHLVRNAIDHGLETPEERVAKGKPAGGSLTLSAYQRGGNIFIEVAEDGRGLDRSRILAKAQEKGLLRAGVTLSDDEIHSFIFHPGFSTAAKVTELSGRGVGLDVVRRNVEELKGKISILTTPGKGTTFRIQLPLTLAMLDGLALKVGSETFLMPLLSVAGSFKPARNQLSTVGRGTEVVEMRERYLPLIRLHRVMQRDDAETDPCRGIVVVVDDGERAFAVLADELLGQQQVVVKSLEANYGRLPGISGATVLGDGRVALIIDVAGLFDVGQRPTAVPEHSYSSKPMAEVRA